MLVGESQRSRRFVGRVARGEELCAALRRFCQEQGVRSGEVRASGLLSAVELIPYERDGRGYLAPWRMRSQFELLHLWGTIALRDGDVDLQLRATLVRNDSDRGGGLEVVGGIVAAADVVVVEFVLDSFDDIVLERAHDAALGVATLRSTSGDMADPPARAVAAAPTMTRPPAAASGAASGHAATMNAAAAAIKGAAPSARSTQASAPAAVKRPAPARPAFHIPEGGPPVRGIDGAAPARSGEPSWTDAIRRSAEMPEPTANADVTLHAGDVLEHFKFGRCEVLRVHEGDERVSVRLGNGRLVELGLEVLRLQLLPGDGERRIFKVHPAKR
jgi:predicted DNA-binding protein with PD1-like motif